MFKIYFCFLFIASCLGQEFRGGYITWSVPANSTTVTFNFGAYWTPGQHDTNLLVSWGDGYSEFVALSSPMVALPSFALTTATKAHTFPSYGQWTTSFEGCCRLVTKNSAGGSFRVLTRSSIDGTYQVSPVLLSGAPYLSIGIGSNSIPITASLPGQFDFSPFSMSEIDMNSVVYGVGAPSITADAIIPSLATMKWVTSNADAGLWSVQMMLESTNPSNFLVVSDFIIKVENTPVSTNAPVLSSNPNSLFFSINSGQDLQFSLTCSASAGSSVGLYVAGYQNGMSFNGIAGSGINSTAGTAVAFKWTQPPTVGGLTTPYLLSFVCLDYKTYLVSSPLCIKISVGIPLVLTAPPSYNLQCWSNCKCVETAHPVFTSGCCNEPSLSFEDYPLGNGNCHNTIIRMWTATNQCGQTAHANQTITVNDITPPSLGIPTPTITSVQCYNQLSQPGKQSTVSVTDNCDKNLQATMTVTSTNGTSNCNNIVTRTFTATDSCGNSNFTTQIIPVNNNVPPTFSIVSNINTVKCLKDIGAFDNIVIARDICEPLTNLPLTYMDSAYPLPECGSFNRTWTATTTCGYTNSLTKTLTVKHTELPSFIMPYPAVSIQCISDCFFAMPTATSYCGRPLKLYMLRDVNDSYICKKYRAITWVTEPDECGLTNTAIQNISVSNSVPPTLNLPSDKEVQCSTTLTLISITDPIITGRPTAHDACGVPLTDFTYSDSVPTGTCNLTILRTWKVVDNCGLITTGVQKIKVIDTLPPVFSVCPFYGQCPEDVKNITKPEFVDCQLSVTYNYNDAIATLPTQPANCGNRNISRTWILNDGCGNSASHVQMIYIADTIPPKIYPPCDASIDCPSKANPSRTGFPTVWDNCKLNNNPTYTDNQVSLTLIVRTWTIVDNCGNSASVQQNIHLNLTTPSLHIPPDATVPCLDATHPDLLGYATAFDNCIGNLTPTWNDTITGTCPIIIKRTWYVYDNMFGQTFTGVQTITVYHDGAGEIGGMYDVNGLQCVWETLSNVEYPGYSKICAEDVITGPNYTDTIVPSPQTCANARDGYTVHRVWKIVDQCGRITTKEQLLYVKDTTPPTFCSFPDDRTINCTDQLGTETPMAHDNCDGDNVPVTYTDVPNSPTCPTQIRRIFTAKDCAGNVATYTQVFTIVRRPPKLNGVPSDAQIECPFIDNYLGANVTALDACGNLLRAVPTFAKSGICPTTFVITWTATDICGVSSTAQQTIIAKDIKPPTLVLLEDALTTGTCANTLPILHQVLATDNCPNLTKPQYTQISGNLHDNCTCVECLQEVVRQWIVYDACGNPSPIVEQRILTQKNQPPTLNVPADYTNCKSCYDDITPDPMSLGFATAFDQCGNKLPVLYTDETSSAYNANQNTYISRTWCATDTCNMTTCKVQQICVAQPPMTQYYNDDDDYIPDNDNYCVWHTTAKKYGCGQLLENLPKPRCKSSCGDISYDFSFAGNCSDESGPVVRNCDVYVSDSKGNKKKVYSGTESFAIDKCPYDKVNSDGIINVPTTPIAYGTDVIPSIYIRNRNLPCDTVTYELDWGDGDSNTVVCNPAAPTPACSYDYSQKTVACSTSHKHKAPGTYTLTVLVYSKGAIVPKPIPKGVTSGKGWQVFSIIVVIFDPTKGRVNGNVQLSGWTIADYSNKGQVQATFCTAFDLNNETVLTPTGNTKLAMNAAQDLFVTEGNPVHLKLYAPTDYGYAAAWEGKGKWQFTNTLVDYKAYALDAHGKVGFTNVSDIFHIIITDPNDNNKVLFDSNPDDSLSSVTQRAITGGSVTVSNPPPVDVYAVTQDEYDRQRSALVGVSIVAGILGLFLLASIAGIIYLYHESRGGFAGFSLGKKGAGSRTVVVPNLGK